MAKIYTKYGDDGYTYTKSNSKTPKNDVVVHLLGEIDELNSSIGYLSSIAHKHVHEDSIVSLDEIMSVLFTIGANIGYNEEFSSENLNKFIEKIEKTIDFFENYNGKIENFILPSGTPCAGYAHVCRAICRRVERKLYDVDKIKENKVVFHFFNRLSDYLFSFARTCNRMNGVKEVIWRKII